jgi:D-methionine transport system ATP-binding protein
MITVSNLCKTFTDKKKTLEVLKNVNLVINDNDSVAIVGQSGAGKSTLIRILNGIITKTSGEVKIDGLEIDSLNGKQLRELRHKTGMVFQHFNLMYQSTVYQNVKFTLDFNNYPKDKIEARVMEVLNQVGLGEKANNYPATLSGGEKQRVGIARAIINNPKYLLLDEITSALDTKTSYDIINLILKLRKEYLCTIIFISHQLEISKELCSRFVIIENGEISVDLSTLELFTNPTTPTTKALVESVINSNTVSSEYNYRLVFIDDVSTEPIIFQLSNSFPNNSINILFARRIFIYEHELGYMDVEIKGPDVPSVIEYIKKKGIKVSKL